VGPTACLEIEVCVGPTACLEIEVCVGPTACLEIFKGIKKNSRHYRNSLTPF